MSRRHERVRPIRNSRGQQTLQTPAMLDVVFLLLIFFIATATPTLLEARHVTQRPGADRRVEAAPPPDPVRPLFVHVAPDGYRIQGHRIAPEELRADLLQIGDQNPATTVLIRVHLDAMNAQVIGLLDTCTACGLQDVKLVSP